MPHSIRYLGRNFPAMKRMSGQTRFSFGATRRSRAGGDLALGAHPSQHSRKGRNLWGIALAILELLPHSLWRKLFHPVNRAKPSIP